MKQINITIHPFSALIGAAIVCLTMLTVGAVTVQGSSSTRDVSAIENVNEPHPRDNVVISGGMPFVVPSGKLLVVTALGTSSYMHDVDLLVDGIQQVSAQADSPSNTDSLSWVSSVLQLPTPGLTAQSGQTVTVVGSSATRAWGYLVDA